MGIFDRIRGLVGGDDGGEGIDRGAGSDRLGADSERKTGGHGSHWDALTEGPEEIQQSIRATVEEGRPTEGRAIEGETVRGFEHPTEAPLRTCVLSVGQLVATAYPVGDGVTHEATVERVVEWGNDVEAQVELSVGPATLGAFDRGYFRRPSDYGPGDQFDVELSAFAYDLNRAEAETLTTEDGREFSTEGMAGVVPLEEGDLDDLVIHSTPKEVETTEFLGRTVYRVRLPLFRVEDGSDVDVWLYASEHVTAFTPREGQDVEGVVWLQCLS